MISPALISPQYQTESDEKKEYYQQADIVYHIIRATIIRNIETDERMNPLTPESD